MDSSPDNPLFPGEYEVSGGDTVFLDTPPGAFQFAVFDPNGDLLIAEVQEFGVPSAGGIYFSQESLESVTRVVFSPIESPDPMGGLSGPHTIGVGYELPYLMPVWVFHVDRTGGGDG